MFRTNFIAPIVVLLAACTSLHADERRPNIVLMYTDDQPQNCMGIMGNKYI